MSIHMKMTNIIIIQMTVIMIKPGAEDRLGQDLDSLADVACVHRLPRLCPVWWPVQGLAATLPDLLDDLAALLAAEVVLQEIISIIMKVLVGS